MTILGICNNSDILSIIRIVKIVITLIKIIVPIILILSLMINYMSAVKDNDSDLLVKANKNAIPKIIAALLVFFIPTFVHILAEISSYNSENYMSCFGHANREYISELIITEAKLYMEVAEQSLIRSDYTVALKKIAKIDDKSVKEELLAKMDEIETKIEEREDAARQERENRQRASSIASGVSNNIENVLGIVYYNQCDSRWGNIQYNTVGGPDGTPATVCSSGCGYTSFAMIAAGLNNNLNINPYSVIKHMRNISDGELTNRSGGAAGWGELTGDAKLAKYNLKARNISAENIENALRNGEPVLVLFPGHYITLSISKSGNIVLLDPFTSWGGAKGKNGEYRSLDDLVSIYGEVISAAAYSRY